MESKTFKCYSWAQFHDDICFICWISIFLWARSPPRSNAHCISPDVSSHHTTSSLRENGISPSHSNLVKSHDTAVWVPVGFCSSSHQHTGAWLWERVRARKKKDICLTMLQKKETSGTGEALKAFQIKESQFKCWAVNVQTHCSWEIEKKNSERCC